MKRPLVSASAAALLCCAASLAAAAPLNRCTDPQTGAVSFTDRPCPAAPGAVRADPVAQQRSAADAQAQQRSAVAADLERQLAAALQQRQARDAVADQTVARLAPGTVAMDWDQCTRVLLSYTQRMADTSHRVTTLADNDDYRTLRLCTTDRRVVMVCSREAGTLQTDAWPRSADDIGCR